MNLTINRITSLLNIKLYSCEVNGITKYYNKDYDVLLCKNQVLIIDKRKEKHVIYTSVESLEHSLIRKI